jgi:predicted PurR-regulated permease PerM
LESRHPPILKKGHVVISSGTLKTLLFAVLLVALILAAADLLVVTVDVLLLILAGVLFGIFIGGISQWIAEHSPLSYRWAYAVVVILIISAIIGGGWYMGSQIVAQAGQLTQQLQTAWEQLQQRVEQWGWPAEYLPDQEQLQQAVTAGSGVMSRVQAGLSMLGWGLTALAVIFFVGLYVAYDPHLYATGVVKLVPLAQRPRAIEVLQKLRSTLGYWLIGRMISMSVIGVLTVIGLWWLKVPLALMLGVLAALFTFIPNIGPILATVPQALMALQVDANTALYVVIFNIALQTVESYLMTPMVERYEVALPPAMTIMMQLLGGVLIGAMGIVMAAPLTAAAMLLIQMLYVRDQLGDPRPGELAERD